MLEFNDRALVLSGERLDDRLGVLVKHEGAAVEKVRLGCRQSLLQGLRGRQREERVVSPPADKRRRLLVLQKGLTAWQLGVGDVQEAIRQGGIRPDVHPEDVIDLLYGPILLPFANGYRTALGCIR
jgi:hypothetical protein